MDTISSLQDKSKQVSVIIPMMLKEATREELALLNASRPDINVDQSAWRLAVVNTAEKIQNRIECSLRKKEEKCGLSNEN